MFVYVCVYSVCVKKRLATGRSLVQGVLPTLVDKEKIKFTYLDTVRNKRSRLRKKKERSKERRKERKKDYHCRTNEREVEDLIWET
jgi:hypothetical protein